MKQIIKKFIPPICLDILNARVKYGFFGKYSSWELCQSQCDGYDAQEIINKVYQAMLKVKNNEAKSERDSVVFHKVQYSWPMLAALMYISAVNGGG